MGRVPVAPSRPPGTGQSPVSSRVFRWARLAGPGPAPGSKEERTCVRTIQRSPDSGHGPGPSSARSYSSTWWPSGNIKTDKGAFTTPEHSCHQACAGQELHLLHLHLPFHPVGLQTQSHATPVTVGSSVRFPDWSPPDSSHTCQSPPCSSTRAPVCPDLRAHFTDAFKLKGKPAAQAPIHLPVQPQVHQ